MGIYNFLPKSLQNIAISIYGYWWQSRRFGGIFKSELKGYIVREKFTAHQWNDYINAELRKILLHAYHNVPYYKGKFESEKIDEKLLASMTMENLGVLPLLTKSALKQFGTTTLLAKVKEKGGEFYSSSGTTGTPTKILFSTPMHQKWSAAFEARIRRWAGVNYKMSRGMIGGRRVVPKADANPPFYRFNTAEQQVYFSAYHIAKKNLDGYYSAFHKYPIKYMNGYAMSNYFLARFFDENNYKLPALRAVITSSEKLTPEMRETFKRVYQCKTFDSWSGVEACALVSECEQGSLHVSPDVGIIELLNDKNEPCLPGELGRVVCTGFLNYDQPLIRYEIGDIMIWDDKPCSCGRNMPVIREIIGRIEDVVVGKDGREIVRFHGIFVGLKNVQEAQVIQYSPNKFEIKVVAPNGVPNEEEQLMRNRMESQLGEIELKIIGVDEIPKGKNGKFKAVISHVQRNTIQ